MDDKQKQQWQADGTYTLEMIGKRCTLRRQRHRYGKVAAKARGPITEYSRKARAAKLRRIAEVNWKAAGECQFLTLTYPDEVVHHTMDQRKTHRYLINRFICQGKASTINVIDGPCACFWRVEWVPRLTGIYVGQMMPHMHFLYLGMPRICEMKIRLKWMSILNVSRYVQVKIKSLDVPERVSVYVAKYCAKEATSQSLDNVPKRNRTGRHAGEWRKELIPMHTLETVKVIDRAMMLFLKRRACELLWWYDPRIDDGFTILGDEALNLIRDIHENYLDYRPGKEYIA